MATHSSILAWRIPWTEEPARLLSVGLQRVRHDRACMHRIFMGFPGGSVVKNLPDNAGDLGSVPESWRSPGEVNGNPLQYSCWDNPMDTGAWWAAVHGLLKSRTRLTDRARLQATSAFWGKFCVWNGLSTQINFHTVPNTFLFSWNGGCL